MKKMLTWFAVLGTLAVGIATPAQAQVNTRGSDDRMLVTFSGVVRLPGVELAGGSYQFKFADPAEGEQNIVSVLSADGKVVIAQLETIPVARVESEENHGTVVMLRKTGGYETPRVEAWFPAAPDTPMGSEDVGCEFIYRP